MTERAHGLLVASSRTASLETGSVQALGNNLRRRVCGSDFGSRPGYMAIERGRFGSDIAFSVRIVFERAQAQRAPRYSDN